MISWSERVQKAPIWLAIVLCFAVPAYANILWGSPPNDVDLITLIFGTLFISTWLSMPQILIVVFMYLTRQQAVRWALLALSLGVTWYVGEAISFPFKTASSMATAHVMAPIYGVMIVAAGGAAILTAEWLIRRMR